MEKTIIASATLLPSPIAVIRLSGSLSHLLINKCFISSSPLTPNKLTFGNIVIKLDKEQFIDEAMAVIFCAPHSFTGEDMAELHIHGSPILVEKTLEFCINNGAQLAQKGEFSKRAFLNNKIDLTKAEGIVNTINASAASALSAALSLSKGKLNEKINLLQNQLIDLIAQSEAAIDYPEEDIEEQTGKQIKKELSILINKLDALMRTYPTGKLIKEGIKISLLGEVNAGKSMLTNTLIGEEKNIVTAIKGTTRDIITHEFNFKGYKIIISDTAGIRQTNNKVEKIGIQKAIQNIINSDIIIYLLQKNSEQNNLITDIINSVDNNKIIYTINKSDSEMQIKQIAEDLGTKNNPLKISAKKIINIEVLKQLIINKANLANKEELIITEKRHFDALRETHKALTSAYDNVENVTMDLTAQDLNCAHNFLGEITGKKGAEYIIDALFSKFCVGK